MNILIYLIEVLFLSLMARSITIRIFRLIYWISKSKKLAVWTVWLIFLPGTVIHELSHILFSIILLVPFGNFNLIPQFDEKGIKMGSVSIAKTDVIRRQLIGAAPFIIGNLLLALGFYYFVENKLFSDYLYLLIMIITTFEIANTMFSSKSDIEGLGLLLIILVLCLSLIYLVNRETIYDLQKIVLIISIHPALNWIVKAMAVPLAINTIIIFFSSFVEKGLSQEK